MAGIAQIGQKRLTFMAVPQVQTKMRKKGKREKQNKTKHKNAWVKEKHTNIYLDMYIYTYTHTHGHTNICKYRYTYPHKHNMYYSSQIVLFDNMFESTSTVHFFSWVRQPDLNKGTNIRNCFLSHICLAKGFVNLENLFLVRIVQSGANSDNEDKRYWQNCRL